LELLDREADNRRHDYGRVEGVVHQNIDPAVDRDNLVHRSVDLAGIANVADDTKRSAACRLDVGHDAVHIRGGE
jgi:hypothetical protein